MPRRRCRSTFGVACVLLAGCASAASTPPPVTASLPTTTDTVPVTAPQTSAAAPSTSTTAAPAPLVYVFPFTGKKVSYGHRHSGYPATDVFGCGATVVAPVRGTVQATRRFDLWDPKVNDPSTRGGKYVSMIGADGVRYYFAHLDSVSVWPADDVDAGTPLGVMGQTGDARNSVCHTHVGISWPCTATEWAVRRGEVWPWRYLDAWRAGEQLAPIHEVALAEAGNPDGCNLAAVAPSAGDA